MKLNNLLFGIIALFALVAAPANAVTIFNDGFNSGNTNAWTSTVTPSNISTTFINQNAEAPVGQDESMAIYSVRFFIHNNDAEQMGDIFIEKTWLRALVPNLSSGFAVAIRDNSGNPSDYTPGTLGVQMSAWCETFNRFLWAVENDCPGDTDTHFSVDDDREFMITVIFTNRPGGTTGFYRMGLNGFAYDHNGSDGDGDIIHTAGFPLNTDTVFVQNADIINLVPDAFPKDPRRQLFDTGLEFKIEVDDNGTAQIVPLNL